MVVAAKRRADAVERQAVAAERLAVAAERQTEAFEGMLGHMKMFEESYCKVVSSNGACRCNAVPNHGDANRLSAPKCSRGPL